MRISVVLITGILLSALHLSAGEAEVEPSCVLIKFRPSHPAATEWLADGRVGEINELRSTLGAHNTEPYLFEATLASVSAARHRSFSRMRPNAERRLDLIAIVRYTSNADPHVVARKLRSLPFIENADPLPIVSTFSIPNDPYFDQQYHLTLIKANDAWDSVAAHGKEIVVGVVDTGLDTAHIDLKNLVWRNPGETGLDASNNDRRSNKIDDDGNGFVDDWYGWDFSGSNGNSPDNSPLPGNEHGTHVGGLVGAAINNGEGVCGTANNVKIMPVKVGRDAAGSTRVEHSADGILYAASNGASVINCSFGSSSPTFADAEVIAEVMELGALLVAAAGNDQSDRAFYPASHPQVLSVASTDDVDEKSIFSNIHYTVDVSAPGSVILSTVPGNRWDFLDGTSMASPIVAGIAAMIRGMDSSLTADEVRALIKANVDNIDALNTAWLGKIGTGRVNAFKAVNRMRNRFAEVSSYVTTDTDGDSLFLPNDELHFSINVKNILDPLINARIVVSLAPSTFQPILQISTADLGAMAHGETKTASNEIVVTLPADVPQNATLSLMLTLYDADTVVGRELIEQTVHPTFRTIHENNIAITFNSGGNIGYNDYPENSQGDGCLYNNGRESLLFEGALMIGNASDRISDVARGYNSEYKNNDFVTDRVIELRRDSVVDGARLVCVFHDREQSDGLGVQVRHQVFARIADSLQNVVFSVYDITNTTTHNIENIHASLFMDWDIGPSGADNGCAWDNEFGVGVLQNAARLDLPTVGVAMVSGLPLDFYAVDNAGSLYTPGVYDSYTDDEKWMMMSSGLSRTNSAVTDVSIVIGGGPFSLAPGMRQQVCFVFGVGENFTQMSDAITAGRNAAMQMGFNAVPFVPLTLSDSFVFLANGNAIAPGVTTAQFAVRARSNVSIDFVDLFGRPVGEVFTATDIPSGIHEMQVEIPTVATGTYFLRFTTPSTVSYTPLQIIP